MIDCWGNTDSFDNFEYFGGSRLRDTMRGSDWDGEIFRGYRGGDWIDGGGGNRDWCATTRMHNLAGFVASTATSTMA